MKTVVCCWVASWLLIGSTAFAELKPTAKKKKNESHAVVRPTEGFVRIFDGYTLDGWKAEPAENIHDFSVRDGVLVAEGSKDRLVYLIWKERPANFELKLQYRMVTEGNSGVEVRAHVDTTGKRPYEGYHADFGHVGIGPQVLGAWDFHFAKREEYDCRRGTRLIINEDGSKESTLSLIHI